MKSNELFSHLHKGSCTQTHTGLMSWVSAQVGLVCTAEAVTEQHLGEEVRKIHFEFTTFYQPTSTTEQVATTGLISLNFLKLESLSTNIEKADFVHDELHEAQIRAQEAILFDLQGACLLTEEEAILFEQWLFNSIEKREPLSAIPNRMHLKSIDHSQRVGVLIRSYLDDFFTAYA